MADETTEGATDGAETETETKSRGRRRKAAPEAPEGAERYPELVRPRDDAGEIWVVSKLPRIQRATHREFVGTNKQSKQDEFRNHVLEIKPGLNIVDAWIWDRCSQHGTLRREHEAGKIGPLKHMCGHADPAKVKAGLLIEHIEGTANVDLLRKLAEADTRDAVAAAISEQIEKCDHRYEAERKAKLAQRAHNRRGRSR